MTKVNIELAVDVRGAHGHALAFKGGTDFEFAIFKMEDAAILDFSDFVAGAIFNLRQSFWELARAGLVAAGWNGHIQRFVGRSVL